MSYLAIEFAVADNGVARLTLNRPAVRNAMNGEMYDEARVVVATGVVAGDHPPRSPT